MSREDPSRMITTIGLVQMRCEADKSVNVERALAGVQRAAEQGARIICLQELFSTLYFCQEEREETFALAEPIPGPATEAVAARARDLGVVVVAPIFEKRAPGVYFNSAAIIEADGSLLGVYRKMHIPDDPQFSEKYYFAPGDLGFRSWNTRFGKIGVCICWDQWYPEAARLTALSGAEILFYPTAIGWLPADEAAGLGERQVSSWETIQRSHAIANGCFVAAANRVGFEAAAAGGGAGITFWGQSFVADPAGQVVARAGADGEEVLVTELDLGAVERQRIQWPFFRDRRVDRYGGLTERFGDGS